MVQFLYRPEYYQNYEWDGYYLGSTENEAEYIVAKNRNGGLVKSRMRFEKQFTHFSDLDD